MNIKGQAGVKKGGIVPNIQFVFDANALISVNKKSSAPCRA
jgi:hypothetical protein